MSNMCVTNAKYSFMSHLANTITSDYTYYKLMPTFINSSCNILESTENTMF